MATIDNLGAQIYAQYAKRTALLEQLQEEYHLREASSIPPQLQALDLSPRMSEIDTLLGTATIRSPWAHFFPPPAYRAQRRSPFGFFRVAPSLGSFEKEEEDEEALDDVVCETEEEEREKQALKNCFAQIRRINQWISFIVGRVGQFLQG